MSDYLSECADIYIRAAIGNHVHVPLNMIFQGIGDKGKAAGIFQFQAPPTTILNLVQGADLDRNHVLVLGDAFIRTKIVCKSQHLMGCGIAGIYTSRSFAGVEGWIKNGKILKGNEHCPDQGTKHRNKKQ